jgi:hypothetical protein
LAEHQINKIQETVAQYLLLIERRDTANGHWYLNLERLKTLSSSFNSNPSVRGCSAIFGLNLVMAHHPLLIEILVGINHQDTPSSLSRHTPEMTIYHLQKDPFYLDSDIYNRPSDGFQHSLLKDHVGYQYQK